MSDMQWYQSTLYSGAQEAITAIDIVGGILYAGTIGGVRYERERECERERERERKRERERERWMDGLRERV